MQTQKKYSDMTFEINKCIQAYKEIKNQWLGIFVALFVIVSIFSWIFIWYYIQIPPDFKNGRYILSICANIAIAIVSLNAYQYTIHFFGQRLVKTLFYFASKENQPGWVYYQLRQLHYNKNKNTYTEFFQMYEKVYLY